MEILPAIRLESSVQDRAGVFCAIELFHDRRIDFEVALTATGRDDHVGRGEQLGPVGDTGVIQRQAGSIDAEVLPGTHLALIAALRDLLVDIDLNHSMHGVGGLAFGVDRRLWNPAGGQLRPVSFGTLAQ
jgi:hypothetical protein